MPKAVTRDKVFICYSHADRRCADDLLLRLKTLERRGALDLWMDTRIKPSNLWLDEIRDALARTKVAVLLVSQEFLDSEFIAREELPRFLGAAVSEGVRVLPLFVGHSMVHQHDCLYVDPGTGQRRAVRLTQFEGLNDPKKPLSDLKKSAREKKLVEIVDRILECFDREGERTAPPSTAAPTTRLIDFKAYLEKVREDNRYLDVSGMGAKAVERMELRNVYTRLRVAAPTGEEEMPRAEGKHAGPAGRVKRGLKSRAAGAADLGEPRTVDRQLRDVLAGNPNIVLIGDPGSGKTTFLRFVALNLARAHLGQGRKEAMTRLGLAGEPPLPVLVRLADFGAFLRDDPGAPAAPEAPEHFYRFLDQWVASFHADLPHEALRRRVLEGGCMLLLDGMDEVPDNVARERVGRILEQVILGGRSRGNRHVITARTRAYRGKAQLQGDVTRCHLVDFGPAEIEEFLGQWCRALYRVEGRKPAEAASRAAEAYRAELVRAVNALGERRALTGNPLMLTVLAVVHWSRRKLPEQRAELYDQAVNALLEAKEKQSSIPVPTRKECFQAVALRMFQDEEGVRKALGRAEAAEAVRGVLNVKLPDALAFVENEELHSGLLVSRVEGEVEFWHLTFQEFLAALELSLHERYWDEIEAHLHDDRWSEVVLLLGGCRRRLGIRPASDFIRKILAREETVAGRARAVGLVGRILKDILPYGGDPAFGTGYEEALRGTLSLFESGAEPVAESTRVEVGEALGQAGDPRLDDEGANRVLVPGGTFWMGTQADDPRQPGFDPERHDREGPIHQVTLSPFLLDRFPVTVQQFRGFVEAGRSGYLKHEVWNPEGWTWRENPRRVQPSKWEKQLRHPNRPVVWVSWYEADAYARWAGGRLPTEAEREYAARGREGRKYPWGDDPPTDRHANFENRIGAPTPVGIYPLGATAEGIHDMAGNVLEWCADWYGAYANAEMKDPAGPKQSSARVLRGGGFTVVARILRSSDRYYGRPIVEHKFIGFRCAWSSAAGRK